MMLSGLLVVAAAASAADPSKRAVSWWADPATTADVDGLVAFATKHKSIVHTGEECDRMRLPNCDY